MKPGYFSSLVFLAQSRLKFQVLQEERPNGWSEQAMIVALIRRLLSVTHSNQSSGKVPHGQNPSSRPWQQTACQEEVGSITGQQNEEALSMNQEN